MRRSVIAVAMTAMVLAGCDGGEPRGARSAAPSGPAPVAVAADFIGYGRGELAQLGVPPGRPDPSTAWIVGLGYQLSIVASVVSPTLAPAVPLTDARASASSTATVVAKGAPARAAEGHEFVVVELSSLPPPGDYSPLSAPEGESSREKLSVTVGDRRPVALGSPRSSELLVVSAPVGAPVTVTAADGRPQALDLRTARRIDGIAGLYPSLPRQSSTSGPDFSFRVPPFQIGTRIGGVTLTPATHDLGWARVGQAWLIVPITITAPHCGQDCTPASLVLDVVKSVRLRDGTRQYPARAGTGKTGLQPQMTVYSGTVHAVFQVPAAFRSGTLRLTFTGSVRFGNGSTSRLQDDTAHDVRLTLT